MTCDDVLQGSAYPIHMVWDGLGGNLLILFRGESGRITAMNSGADRSAPEVENTVYLKYGQKGGERAIFFNI